MSENNEISNASSPETDAQPSLDLPGRRKTRVGRLKLVVVALMMIALGAAGVTVYLQRLFQQHQEAKQAALNKPKDTASSDATTDLEAQKMRIKRDEADRARQASEAAAAAAEGRLATPAGAASQATATNPYQQTGTQPNSPAPLTPAQRRLQGSVLAGQGNGNGTDHAGPSGHDGSGLSTLDGNGDSSGSGSGGMADLAKSTGLAALRGGGTGYAGGGSLASPTSGGDNNKGSSFDQSLQPSKLAAMRASFRPNRNYLISRNTQIRCVQDTAIRTDHPGLTGCTVAQDVWSDDGSTLLVRKGAEAKGEQRDAMLQGQGSIAVIWDEIDDGDVTIPLNSPATDQLGAAGIPAYVDEHFWMRFKGALMVSLIGDFGQALANKATGSGSQITFSNSSNATQDVAAEALRHTINIPPTAYSNQGSVINIFVARDVDLSQQYENVGIDGNPVVETTPQ
jgi:type IV secretion system protein VirB10